MAGLDQHFARLGSAPRSSRNLGDLLIGAFCRPQIPAFKAKIGINHANQRQLGEVIALGHQLGTDNHIDQTAFGRRHEFRDLARRIERI